MVGFYSFLMVGLLALVVPTHLLADPRLPDIRKNRICFISDLNGSYGSIDQPASVHAGMRVLAQHECGVVVGAGDLVAGQDLSLSEGRLAQMWSEWKRVVLDPLIAQRIPFLSALGNHDASAARTVSGNYIYSRERTVAQDFLKKNSDSFEADGVVWISRERFPFFYSLQFGTIGLIFIDGSSATELRTQRQWLEDQLRELQLNASLTTRIVVGHLPLVAVAKGRDRVGEILADSQELYELFDRSGVDLYVSGHHHAYYPGRVSAWSPRHGTVQLALGALGNGPRALLGAHPVPVKNSLTVLDIDESGVWAQDKFTIKTLNPLSGERITPSELPDRLPSVDGSGRPVVLERFDFREFFP